MIMRGLGTMSQQSGNTPWYAWSVFRSSRGAARVLALGVLLLLFVFVPTASALDPLQKACEESGGGSAICDDQTTENPIVGDGGILTTVTNILTIVTAVIAVIVIVIAGMTMSLSGGNSQKVQQSRDAIIYAAIALAVAFLAQAVVRFIVNRVGGS